ncbi:unnamed protein product [Enterobius vermicularis]|uniref:Transmembrane protein n=1 Tax=Enterobius vermicularis TaxID=51028 RepID=A0A0N4VBS2_ENTVE|nr:unnamed protein product [Enterobius vermicularis]
METKNVKLCEFEKPSLPMGTVQEWFTSFTGQSDGWIYVNLDIRRRKINLIFLAYLLISRTFKIRISDVWRFTLGSAVDAFVDEKASGNEEPTFTLIAKVLDFVGNEAVCSYFDSTEKCDIQQLRCSAFNLLLVSLLLLLVLQACYGDSVKIMLIPSCIFLSLSALLTVAVLGSGGKPSIQYEYQS